MVVTRPFDIQWQFSRHKRLLRKSKVGDALVEILSRKGRKVKRDTRERERERKRINGAPHRKPAPTFSSSRSLFLFFRRFISASIRFSLFRFAFAFSFSSRNKTTLSLLFTTTSYRHAAPYYSSYVNEFRLIIWERSRTENENGGNVGVRGLAPKRG